MKPVTIAVLLALSACAPLPAPPVTVPGQWLEIDGAMLQFLDSIHDGLKTEIMLCLTGDVYGDIVRVTRFRATPVQAATRERIDYDRCDPHEFVGIVHSHPSDGGCYLSLVDQNTAEKNDHQIDLVVCGGGTFAWQTKGASGIITRRP